MAEQNELNQRVVYYGLRRMTSSRNEISAGFTRWYQQFGSQPLDVIEVVTDLVAHLGVGVAEKKALMLGMHSASSKLFAELEPVPSVLLESIGSGAVQSVNDVVEPAATSGRPPEVETLERFLQLSSQYLKRSSAGSFNELADILSDESLPNAPADAVDSLRAWGKSGLIDISLNSGLSVDACQNIAHDYYVLVSEVVGPVVADTTINKTIDDLLTSELAQRFNPRDLL